MYSRTVSTWANAEFTQAHTRTVCDNQAVVFALVVWQEKITKEMNYILSNQDTVLAQITQLESAITQTEVITTYYYSGADKNVAERDCNTSHQRNAVAPKLQRVLFS